MISGCYTLHLYCDVTGCMDYWWSECAGIDQPQTHSGAMTIAKAHGWSLFGAKIYCPKHSAEARK